MAERAHDLQAVLRHGALAIGHVLGIAGGHGARAIAARVGDHQRAVPRELGRDLVPGDVRHRVAVQQQQRRSGAAGAQENLGPSRLDASLGEARKQVGDDIHGRAFSRAMARQPMSLR
jgi:hypothetical protein